MANEKISDEKLRKYVKSLREIGGVETDSLIRRGLREKETFLVIKIGNGDIADKAIDDLLPIRKKAGLSKEDMPIALDEDKGLIMIPVNSIVKYDMKNGDGALFKKLVGVKDDLSKVLKAAKSKADEIAKIPTLEGKINGEGDFSYNSPEDIKRGVNIDNSKYEKEPLVITGANFKLPDSVKKAALEYAKQMKAFYKKSGIDIAQTRELGAAAKLDGQSKTLTDEELASYLLAKSMSRPRIPPGAEVEVTFNNKMSGDAYFGKNGSDPKVVFEMAKQILGDTFGKKVEGGVDTTTAAGNKPYLDAINKSSKNETLRC